MVIDILYDISGKVWLQLSNSLYACSTLAILNGLPTTIGGDLTNKLMSLTKGGKWAEKFPQMPTKRYFVAAVCTGTALIVAGGWGRES